MPKTTWCLSLLCGLAAITFNTAFGADLKSLHGHVPAVVPHLNPTGRLAATNELRLAIGVPLRDPAGLDDFLAQLYDPASTNYHQYLSPEQFADRFGPTEQDYQAVKEFARTNGLKIVTTHRNRLLLDVVGPAASVEKALHITLRTYQHPTEARQFFAPDTEPAVAGNVPMADIQGLSDYSKPHPRVKQKDVANIVHNTGSAPDGSGSYFGNDFRNAYVPGISLTGAGQMVGLLQFDGFYSNDIAAYATAAGGGRASIPIQTVLLDGYNGTPTTGANSGNVEVSLDIEMTMAMAPGLSKIVVFEAGPSGNPNDILNSMVTYSNTVKQLSSSWGWSGGPSTTTDNIYKNMAAAGQSFFNASGDSDAFTTGASSANGVDNTQLQNAPSSSPYITQVGGTTLTMTGTGASYSLETVWNWGYDSNAGAYVGSSGGISSYYTMPSWQTNVSNMAGRGGSASYRNIPDVALTADNIYVVYGGSAGGSGGIGGTSCAAPLWAGFMALVNQQASANGKSSVGFVNPAIYTIAAGASYSSCFHDVTTGNNTSSSSPSLFYATNGYDLCTGLGTPNGAGLITALAGSADSLGVSPATGYTFSGPNSGPFTPTAGACQLTNNSAASLAWSLINTSAWLTADFTSGSLAAHTTTNFNFTLTSSAASLPVGNYATTATFTNQTSHVVQRLSFALQVYQPLSVAPTKGYSGYGLPGGPFYSATQTFTLGNIGNNAVTWSIVNTSAWLSVSATAGKLVSGDSTSVTAGLSASANSLGIGTYNANLVFSNSLGVVAAVPFALSVGQSVVENGGFETGDFTGWTQSGNTAFTQIGSGSSESSYLHSGTYAAMLGPSGSLGYLSQNVGTIPGANYLVSFWLRNPTGGTPNSFQVQWNGVTIYTQANIAYTGWTNLQFLVNAPGTSAALQFGFENNPDYFGLDDISVQPLAQVAFKSTVLTANNFQLAWSASTGVVYQVQYKTNLLQSNWINLGSGVTAKTNTLTITDTNAFLHSPQRYYRLMALP